MTFERGTKHIVSYLYNFPKNKKIIDIIKNQKPKPKIENKEYILTFKEHELVVNRKFKDFF